jgi:outer membrane protein
MWNCGGGACSIPRGLTAALIMAGDGVTTVLAIADTLEGTLALAYQSNPQLNAQRAATRAADEGVGIAISPFFPPRY